MTLDEFKTEVEQRTGIPASMLNGSTAGEVLMIARTILDFKKEHEQDRPKTTAEQFSEWMDGTPPSKEAEALSELEDSIRPYSYKIRDGGEVTGLPDGRPAKEQFEEWFNNKTAFDPRREGIW